MKNPKSFVSVSILLSFLMFVISCSESSKEYKSWTVYNGGNEAMKYSSLTQIDTSNVNQLQVAWTYHTGDADASGSQIQCNPIMIDGVLYGVGPQMKLFAVNAMTGKAKWVFDPYSKATTDMNPMSQHIMINSRGVAYWTDGK